MTNEEAITIIRKEYLCVNRDCDIERSCGKCNLMMPSKEPILEAYNMAIKALEQEPCNTDTCKVVKVYMNEWDKPITAEPKVGHCKDCKYFEYDSLTKVDGISLIFAHEICKRWGDGCKTKEDGYCFLFEPQESEDENDTEQLPSVNPQEPKTGHCKDCKWWKDSDGVFRRGIGAESQCPINRKEVYEGNGYCYMFEPQERKEEE